MRLFWSAHFGVAALLSKLATLFFTQQAKFIAELSYDFVSLRQSSCLLSAHVRSNVIMCLTGWVFQRSSGTLCVCAGLNSVWPLCYALQRFALL
jgi:hypothetical protein